MLSLKNGFHSHLLPLIHPHQCFTPISKLATTTKKKKKKQQQQQPMWKYILKEKLHAWFENEREQESDFGELKIS